MASNHLVGSSSLSGCAKYKKPSPKKRGFFLRTRRARTPASSTKQQDSCFGQPSGWAKPEGHGCPESISPDYAPMLGATPNSKTLAQKAGVFCMAHLGSDKMAGQPFWTAVRLGAVPRGKDAPSQPPASSQTAVQVVCSCTTCISTIPGAPPTPQTQTDSKTAVSRRTGDQPHSTQPHHKPLSNCFQSLPPARR